MNEAVFESIEKNAKAIKLGMDITEFARLADEQSFTEKQLESIDCLLNYLNEKKTQTTVATLLRLSRLPMKDPKTFDNFDFSLINGKNIEKLKNLASLSAIYAHKNIAFIGPAGTGKTHLAQAFGYECCLHGLKTYFIKMSELRDRFINARRFGRESSVINGLVRPSCLIIDEIGHCEFDKDCTRMFFDLIDRRYQKEGSFNIVLTSNKNPMEWQEDFTESNALLCALDRIFDDATVFNIKGASYRGRRTERVKLLTGATRPQRPVKK